MYQVEFLFFFLLFIFSGSISIACVPLLRKIALRFSIVDFPNQSHKTHSKPIPYLGGVAIIFPVITLGAITLNYFSVDVDSIQRILSLIVPGFIMFAVGFIDDVRNLSASNRFIIQLVISALLSTFLISNGYSVALFKSSWLDFILSVFWLVGITNAFNLIDNIDGGAAGIATIVSMSAFLISMPSGQYLLAIFALLLCGASLGFLFWNRNPASIYLGDSGALFLGFTLAVLLLQLETSVTSRAASLFLPALLLAVPIIDTTVVVLSRMSRGVSIFQGGRDHLSHRILHFGVSKKIAVGVLWLVQFIFSCIALAIDSNFQNLSNFLLLLGAILAVATTSLSLALPIPKSN
jgi:UDP-GlcNAc:undecaprenyl-phosphate GlcNAc-1-phosphate transferase